MCPIPPLICWLDHCPPPWVFPELPTGRCLTGFGLWLLPNGRETSVPDAVVPITCVGR